MIRIFAYKSSLSILILCMTFLITVPIPSQGETLQTNRLLIDEMRSFEESMKNINAAFEEGNYTIIRHEIDSLLSADSWKTIINELALRNESNLVSSFNNSLLELERSVITKNHSSIEQINIVSEELEKIEQTLGKPLIDWLRLILVISTISALILAGLYIVPRVRKTLGIKY